MNELENAIKERKGSYLVKKDVFIKLYKIDECKELYDFIKGKRWLDVFDLMELVSRASYIEVDSLERNLSIADFIEIMLGNKEKHFFSSNLKMMIMKNYMDNRPTEFDIHERFAKEYKKVLGEDFEIAIVKNDSKNIPDFWLKHKDVLIPVEIKLNDFNKSGLKQLKRYMDFYGCDKGIAVARNLTCPLPGNIKFINHDLLKGDVS